MTLAVLCVALLALGGVAVFAADEDAGAAKQTWTGELVDMDCYSSGQAKGEDHKACATHCMSSGIPAGLLVGDKAYTLLTNPVPLSQYAASQARVTGELRKDTQSIAPSKIEVKQGDDWKEIALKDAHHGADSEH
jgi:hypothetical protein